MELFEDFLCLFTARIEVRQGDPVIVVPDSELEIGDLTEDETYRVAILPPTGDPEPASEREPTTATQTTPVTEGDRYDVEITDIGDQGDGIARISPGYIVFVLLLLSSSGCLWGVVDLAVSRG